MQKSNEGSEVENYWKNFLTFRLKSIKKLPTQERTFRLPEILKLSYKIIHFLIKTYEQQKTLSPMSIIITTKRYGFKRLHQIRTPTS